MRDCVIVGVGQLGRFFAGGAVACGVRVTPVRRGDSIVVALADVAPGAPIVVAVGEAALPGVLAQVPIERRGDVVLVQNELFPEVWQAALGDAEPTIAVVWSTVKKGRPVEVGRATHVFGRHAGFICEAQRALDVPCVELHGFSALETELVAKYAFILAVNALGLEQARPVGAWLDADPARVDAVLAAFVALGEARSGPAGTARAIALEAMEALRSMPAAGRTARERVDRARAVAARLGVPLAPSPQR